MYFVKQFDEVSLVVASHHEIDDGSLLRVVITEKFIRDVDIVFREELAKR
jgi:hypothetical protein